MAKSKLNPVDQHKAECAERRIMDRAYRVGPSGINRYAKYLASRKRKKGVSST
jgi:hypothetical protein